MKASYGWLLELLGDAGGKGLSLSPERVAALLTGAGLEVESSHRFGEASEKVVLARVVLKEPHPTKTKLTLVTVDTGSGTQRVVCGAPNVPEPGALVVLAKLGTHLPAKGVTLEPREIAGVTSEGMLCSEGELGLRISGGEGGILVLPADAGTPGQTLASAIPASCDTVFEIGLTPNRPDGLGHIGLARELAALCGVTFARTQPAPPTIDPNLDVRTAVSVRIEDEERCPTYGAALVEGVKVGASPLGMQYRLEALGIRAISNVVDITNWVMLMFGHPIHGFDLETVRKHTIVVRRAAEGEAMKTLDGVERKLSGDDLVIADGEGPVALAGVMGGEGSGISDATSRVLVECAYFQPRGVRRSARRHGMHTESSHRFERGVDPGDVVDVLTETARLLCAVAGGRAAERPNVVGPGPRKSAMIELRKPTMDALLGVDVPLVDARAVLERLGCTTEAQSDAGLTMRAPSHRPDLSIEVDLIEEVIRVRGVDTIPAVIPAIRPAPLSPPSIAGRELARMTRRVIQAAMGVGLSQSLTFGFTSPKALEAIGAPKSQWALLNPLSEDRTVMRTSLLPGLLEALGRSRRYGVNDVRIFATGARFLKTDGELPKEAQSFAALIAGQRDAVLAKREPIDVFDAKGVAIELLERATGRKAAVRAMTDAERPAHLHPRAAGVITLEGAEVGQLGMLHPNVERTLELGGTAAVIEIDLEAVHALGHKRPRYQPIPTLPASTRDIALVVSDDIAAGAVEGAIREAAGDLAESVELFDLFRGGAVPEGHRSLAFHVVYRDPAARAQPDKARTLTDVEVDERHAKVVRSMAERFQAQLRA